MAPEGSLACERERLEHELVAPRLRKQRPNVILRHGRVDRANGSIAVALGDRILLIATSVPPAEKDRGREIGEQEDDGDAEKEGGDVAVNTGQAAKHPAGRSDVGLGQTHVLTPG